MGWAVAVEVVPGEASRRRLEKSAVSVSAGIRGRLRARIVLAAAEGLANAGIADRVGCSVNTVRKWRGRFAEHGMTGLADARRSGRPRRLGPEALVAIVATATSAPPYPEATWSHRRIAGHLADLAVSASQTGRILADVDIKPYRVRGWLTRKDDPAFASRAADVCDLYLNPPPNCVRLSIDEKTAISARSRKHPGRPAGPGRPARQESGYVRHGTVSIVAASGIDTGQALTQVIARDDSATFVAFLAMPGDTIDPAKDIHVVLDNGSSHVAKNTRAWLAAHPRWHVHWTPVHASWLNQAGLCFSAMARAVIRHGDFTSRDDLIGKTGTYVIEKNAVAKPYRWTYDGTPLKAA